MLIPRLPKNPLTKGHNFRKATKGQLKLYSITSESYINSLFKRILNEHIDDMRRDWEDEYFDSHDDWGNRD